MGERYIGNICAREESTIFNVNYIPHSQIPMAMCERNRLDSCQCQILQVKGSASLNDCQPTAIPFLSAFMRKEYSSWTVDQTKPRELRRLGGNVN